MRLAMFINGQTSSRPFLFAALAILIHALPQPGSPLAASTGDMRSYGYTYQSASGNRLRAGHGGLPDAKPIDLPARGTPLWLVAAPLADSTIWAAVFADGHVQGWRLRGRQVKPIAIRPDALPSGMPPCLVIQDGQPRLLIPPRADATPSTHPIVVPTLAERLLYIGASGDLVFWHPQSTYRLPAHALPDARLVYSADGLLAFLSNPTQRYAHGVLGDGVEAAAISLVNLRQPERVERTIAMLDDTVIEGIAPMLADVDGDGRSEIVVTESDDQRGARLAVYRRDGRLMAHGPAIGQGYRWRHQIAVAPFGPRGEIELVAVRTPHIGGIVEYFQLDGRRLRMVATVYGSEPIEQSPVGDFTPVPGPGFGSHPLGSRNLDMALAGDLDGDGQLELLVPNQRRTHLTAIRRSPDGAQAVWSVPLGGHLTSNLATATLPGGKFVVGAGHDGRAIRLWLPR